MRQASISSTLLKNIGLVIGLGFVVWGSTPVLAQPPIRIMQEYCKCTCGGEEVAVTPTTRPPNATNCKAMDVKTCKNSEGSNSHLSCGGDTIVARPSFEGLEVPVAPVEPPVVR